MATTEKHSPEYIEGIVVLTVMTSVTDDKVHRLFYEMAPFFLLGKFDDVVLASLVQNKTFVARHPDTYEEEAREGLANLKDAVRSHIQVLVDLLPKDPPKLQLPIRSRKIVDRKTVEKIAAQHRANATPHGEGTVAELAQKLGISKGEVRRRKVDGTLNQLIEAQGE